MKHTQKKLGYGDTEYCLPCEKCGKEIRVYTQKDHFPEYYTEVTVKCDCGYFVVFNLPVN